MSDGSFIKSALTQSKFKSKFSIMPSLESVNKSNVFVGSKENRDGKKEVMKSNEDVKIVESVTNNDFKSARELVRSNHISALEREKFKYDNHRSYFHSGSVVPKESAIVSESKKEDEAEVELNSEQQLVLDAVMKKSNVFFTGCAGTGKSLLLRRIVKELQKKKWTYATTASTGIAAVNISGSTLHNWAGFGLGDKPVSQLVNIVNSSRSTLERWNSTDFLIIDEISMLDGELFDKVESIAREVRNCNEPFGGICLILSGDFLQLPPVSFNKVFKFVFESSSFMKFIDIKIQLKQVFRQENQDFVAMLRELRLGQVSSDSVKRLNSCVGKKLQLSNNIEPTKLYPIRSQVDNENLSKLNQLETETICFNAKDAGAAVALTALKKNCTAAEQVVLKVGAQVILLKNLSAKDGLVNGSRGLVTSFEFDCETNGYPVTSKYPRVTFLNGVIRPEIFTTKVGSSEATRQQIPLALAWALTVHKCQGMTLDAATIKFDNFFEYGQGYVALSRLKSWDCLSIESSVREINWNKVFKAHPNALDFYKALASDCNNSDSSKSIIDSTQEISQSVLNDHSQMYNSKKNISSQTSQLMVGEETKSSTSLCGLNKNNSNLLGKGNHTRLSLLARCKANHLSDKENTEVSGVIIQESDVNTAAKIELKMAPLDVSHTNLSEKNDFSSRTNLSDKNEFSSSHSMRNSAEDIKTTSFNRDNSVLVKRKVSRLSLLARVKDVQESRGFVKASEVYKESIDDVIDLT